MSKGDIRFYTDALIVEAVLGGSSLFKTAQSAGALSGVSSMIQSYVSEHIDPNDRAGSVINMLAPAAISMLFRAFGFGKLGLLLGVVASAMHINVGGMVERLWNEVRGTLSKGEQVTPSQIDSAVSAAVQENTQPADQSPSDDALNTTANDLKNARLLRLSVEQYERQMLRLTKEGSPVLLSYAAGRTARTTNLIGRILGWIFKMVLMSAGFMVAGDVANKILGRPNALDKTYQAGQEPSGGPAAVPSGPTTTQTKFKPTQAGTEPAPHPWAESVANNPESIENMLVDFTKQVYSGLDGKEATIRSSPNFQAVKNQIAWYNHAAAGEPMVYIPTNYPNKKALVDHYIDQVASAA